VKSGGANNDVIGPSQRHMAPFGEELVNKRGGADWGMERNSVLILAADNDNGGEEGDWCGVFVKRGG